MTDHKLLTSKNFGKCEHCGSKKGRTAHVLVQTKGAKSDRPLTIHNASHFFVYDHLYESEVWLNPTFGGLNVVVEFDNAGKAVSLVPYDPYTVGKLIEQRVPVIRIERTEIDFIEATKIKSAST